VTTVDGHVLALWVTRPVPKKLSLRETIDAIHEQSGLAILAHPFEPTIAPRAFWRWLRDPQCLLDMGIDAIETHNAGAITPGHNTLARRVFDRLPVAVVGNSDAHSPATIATGITRFAGRTAVDLRQAMVRRQTSAEGSRWPLSVYLRYSIQRRHADFEPEFSLG
jgi:predicted metal-dependent phosphoesterase TrpH